MGTYLCTEIAFPPLPKLKVPALYLGAHGELFSYATLEKDGLAFTMARATIPPGKGPPAHLHHFVHEWFFAPEGGITLFAAETEHKDLVNQPNFNDDTQVTVYLIPLKAGQVFCSTRHHVHGYVNADSVERPIMCIWKPDFDAPHFEPYNDGGTREFFEGVHKKVEDPNQLPELSEKRRTHYISQSPNYFVPHSFHLFQFINRVDPEIPLSMQHSERFEELNEMLDMIRNYNEGDRTIRCQ